MQDHELAYSTYPWLSDGMLPAPWPVHQHPSQGKQKGCVCIGCEVVETKVFRGCKGEPFHANVVWKGAGERGNGKQQCCSSTHSSLEFKDELCNFEQLQHILLQRRWSWRTLAIPPAHAHTDTQTHTDTHTHTHRHTHTQTHGHLTQTNNIQLNVSVVCVGFVWLFVWFFAWGVWLVFFGSEEGLGLANLNKHVKEIKQVIDRVWILGSNDFLHINGFDASPVNHPALGPEQAWHWCCKQTTQTQAERPKGRSNQGSRNENNGTARPPPSRHLPFSERIQVAQKGK